MTSKLEIRILIETMQMQTFIHLDKCIPKQNLDKPQGELSSIEVPRLKFALAEFPELRTLIC